MSINTFLRVNVAAPVVWIDPDVLQISLHHYPPEKTAEEILMEAKRKEILDEMKRKRREWLRKHGVGVPE